VKRARGIELLLLLVLWALLAWRGFPLPHPDDGLFTGAALHLAAGGGLENPLLERPGPYYLYPPFYDFFLAQWLKLAGISAASVIAFHLAVCFASSWLVLEIFRAWGREAWAWIGVLVYVDYIADFGLRSDALGLLFILVSVRLGLASSRAGMGLAPFFAFLGLATHPPLLALALPWLFWLVMTKPPARIGAVAGGAGVGLLLLFILHGDLFGFIRGFLENQARSRGDTESWLMEEWYRPQNIFKVTLLPLLSLAIAGRKIMRGGVSVSDAAFLLALILGGYVMLTSLTGNRLVGLISVLGVLGYLTAAPKPGGKERAVVWIALAVFCVSIGRPLVEGLVVRKPSLAEVQALKEQWRQTPHSRLVVDWWSLRYVFDFRPPADVVYISSSLRPRDRHALLVPGECGLISADAAGQYGLQDPGLPSPVYLQIAGRPLGCWMINAGEMAVISKERP
jgi:hypothetical protein